MIEPGDNHSAGLSSAHPPDAWSRSQGMLVAIAVYVLTRVLVVAVAYAAPQHRDGARADLYWSPIPLVRWDAGHYFRIMCEGYPPDLTDTVAFFPAYSIASRPLMPFCRPEELALVIVSHLAGLLAVMLFYQWGVRHVGVMASVLGCVLLCSYPPAMFFSVAYSDAMLVMLVAMALLLLDSRHLWLAALISAIATGTRPTGAVLALLVFIEALRSGWLRGRWGWLKLLALGTISVSGAVAFQLHLWHHFGRADAFLVIQSKWKLSPVPDPWVRLVTLKPVLQPAFIPLKALVRGEIDRLLIPVNWNAMWSLLILILAGVGLFRQRVIPRISFLIPILVFLEAYLADPLRGGRLIGIARYQLAALPCFLLVGVWISRAGKSRQILSGIAVAVLLALQCLYIARFADWILVS